MNILEKELEAKLVKAIKARGGYCLKWTSPGTTGLPDRIILLPGGRVAFAELKRPKGSRVGPLQKWWKPTLQRLGFLVFTVYTEDDLTTVLTALEAVRNDRTV